MVLQSPSRPGGPGSTSLHTLLQDQSNQEAGSRYRVGGCRGGALSPKEEQMEDAELDPGQVTQCALGLFIHVPGNKDLALVQGQSR